MVDVVFLFPQDFAMSEPYILANIEDLQTISPYWKRMFASGLQESESRLESVSGWKGRFQQEISTLVRKHQKERGGEISVPPLSTSHQASEDSVRYVVIEDASRSMYMALFEALRVGKLQLSEIRSADGEAFGSECDGAKSIYALAHKLEIEQAQKLAIEAFETCLSSDNALQELMSSDAFIYPEINEAAMRAVLKHWATIAEDAQSFIAKVSEEGEVDSHEVLLTTLELYRRVGQAASA
jgi:hypothetical protein